MFLYFEGLLADGNSAHNNADDEYRCYGQAPAERKAIAGRRKKSLLTGGNGFVHDALILLT